MAQAIPSPSSDIGIIESGEQFLTFTLGREEYAIDILKVQEIKSYSTITPIPNVPTHIKGVMNLRGTIVPVVGLREKFGMPAIDYNKFTVIIVLTIGVRVMGLIVDTVSDVIALRTKDIEQTPDLGSRVDTSFILGMGKSDEKLVIMLDVERVLRDAVEVDSS